MGSGLLLLPGELYITKQGDNTAVGKSSAQDPPPRHEITKAPQPCCPLPASGCSHMIGKKTPQPRCRGSVRQAHRLPTVPREKWRAIFIHRVCMAHCAINAVATALLPILARRWRGVRRAGLKIEADQAGQVGPRVVFCGLVWASCDPVLVFSALMRPLRSRSDRAKRLSAASAGCCAAKLHRADGCSAACPILPYCGGCGDERHSVVIRKSSQVTDDVPWSGAGPVLRSRGIEHEKMGRSGRCRSAGRREHRDWRKEAAGPYM